MNLCRGRAFWKTTPLERMGRRQWELLCDGCARCCLRKILFEDTSELAYTRVACRHLDLETCRCRSYGRRSSANTDCLVLTPENLSSWLEFLPETCAYRLLAEDRELPWWHHLVSGDSETVHRAGISVRGWAISEECMDAEDLEDYLID
ncbi:MAG: YcgN family cysteine cluster protein [Desulfomonilia bacterium]|jgi:uncharacterized cysteine cluster protein YcgN (CxxCxxCC family)